MSELTILIIAFAVFVLICVFLFCSLYAKLNQMYDVYEHQILRYNLISTDNNSLSQRLVQTELRLAKAVDVYSYEKLIQYLGIELVKTEAKEEFQKKGKKKC